MPELFKNFEVNREARWPVVLRLLGGSVALHLALIACVVYIPPIRDALNIAALVAGSGYVDKAYARTKFGEDIQIVQASPKFQYPPGYFAIGLAPPSPLPTVDPNAPKIVAEAKPLKAESTPSPAPSPSPASSPSPQIAQSQGVSPEQGGAKTGEPSGDQKSAEPKAKSAEDAQQEEAQKQLEKAAAANHVELPAENEINRKPLKELVAQANDLKNEGKLDLGQSFDIRIEAELDPNGRLSNPTITRKSGDPTLVDLSTRAIGVLNESGLLAYLKVLNEGRAVKVAFVISQDQEHLLATFESEVGTEEDAQQKARFFNSALVLGQVTRRGKDEEVLMKSTSASSQGKKVLLKFKMPRQAVGDMLKKQLASNSAAKQG
jgi:hypothetical protein